MFFPNRRSPSREPASTPPPVPQAIALPTVGLVDEELHDVLHPCCALPPRRRPEKHEDPLGQRPGRRCRPTQRQNHLIEDATALLDARMLPPSSTRRRRRPARRQDAASLPDARTSPSSRHPTLWNFSAAAVLLSPCDYCMS
jgi:hypothetical protein